MFKLVDELENLEKEHLSCYLEVCIYHLNKEQARFLLCWYLCHFTCIFCAYFIWHFSATFYMYSVIHFFRLSAVLEIQSPQLDFCYKMNLIFKLRNVIIALLYSLSLFLSHTYTLKYTTISYVSC